MGIPDLGPVILGGNVFGWTVAKEEAFAILDAYLRRGGRAIDTADSYVAFAPGREGGESETIIGAWMAERKNRADVVLTTKVAKWARQRGLSAKNIDAAIDGSLRRLKTDYIDVYLAHEDDLAVEQAEYVTAFDNLVKAGKVRTLGASNFTPARLASAISLATREGLAKFEISQDQWNLVARDIETDLVPVLSKEGVKETPYFALAAGFLTGKYRPGVKVDSARASGASKFLGKPENVRLLKVLDELAAAHAVSVAAIALAWLRAQPVVAAPIASARTPAQLDPLFEVVTLTPDQVAALNTP